MKRILIILLILIWATTISILFAQKQDSLKTEDILKMSLSDLMNIQIVTAFKIQQSIKDASAAVHVITAEQIMDHA